uniref:Uncharacterized protein n=1 Tax=Astyanax mexicanus TaxID=7994 RepID=A0A8B9GXL9_ASTMX
MSPPRACVLALFLLSALDQADSSAYDKIVAHSRIRAKKEGSGEKIFFLILPKKTTKKKASKGK